MIAHIPSAHELFDAHELAILAVLDANLLATEQVLRLVHPTLPDGHDDDPPSLVAARHVIAAIHLLSRTMQLYRIAIVDEPDLFVEDDLPF